VDEVSQSQRVTGHFLSPAGERMEASYVRHPGRGGQWVYYKIPGSERKCQCQVSLPAEIRHA
jgi:hypothetical protein